MNTLQSRTGPEQGFPCVVFPHMEKSVFNTGFPGDENMLFPVGNTTKGKPCFHYRDGFAVQLSWNFIVLFKPLFLINYIFYHIFDPLLKKSVLIEQLLWCLVNNLIFGACLLRCHPCVENKFHTCNFPGFSGHPLFSSYTLNRLIHKRRYLPLKLDT